MSSKRVIATPRQVRGRARFDALLTEAASLIAKQGVEGVAFSEIARRTGTAQGSLYQYFPSKEALVTTLHARLAQDLVTVVTGCSGEFRDKPAPRTVKEVVALLVPRLADFYAANPAYREIRHALPRNPSVHDAEIGADSRVSELLELMLRDAGARIPVARMPVIAAALIEAGDALLPWAGRDSARLDEVETMLCAYLDAVQTEPELVDN